MCNDQCINTVNRVKLTSDLNSFKKKKRKDFNLYLDISCEFHSFPHPHHHLNPFLINHLLSPVCKSNVHFFHGLIIYLAQPPTYNLSAGKYWHLTKSAEKSECTCDVNSNNMQNLKNVKNSSWLTCLCNYLHILTTKVFFFLNFV